MSDNTVLTEGRAKRKQQNAKHAVLLTVLVALLIFVFLFSLCVGRYSVPIPDVVKILLAKFFPIEQTWENQAVGVVCTLRLPRVLGALLVGSALSLSGAAYQGVFKNPLVAPDLLGVSSGACVGAALAILLGLNTMGVQVMAFVLGIITVALTMLIPRLLRNTSIMMLVLSGIVVKGIMDAVMGIIKYLADPETQLASITYWQMGSLTKVLPRDLAMIGPVILVCATAVILLRWRINILSLGDNEAKSLGINVRMTRTIIIICATLLTACAVCICGTIGWVGLVIPHLSRMIAGEDNDRSIPVCALIGAIFMIVIDTTARSLTSMELPLSILTGLIGAPFYLIILTRQRKGLQ